MLKALMLRKKINDAKMLLESLRANETDFATRAAELAKREEELAKYTEPTFGHMNPDYFASVEEIPEPPATGAVVVPVVAAVLAVASGVVVYKRKK